MRSFRLRGSALFITLIICAGFAVLAITAVDRMVGIRKVTSVDLAKQRSAAAAEAVASMIESRLMDGAADYAKLVTAVDSDTSEATNPWWKLNGCVYRDAEGNMRGPGFDADAKPLWFNGCLVRWMVEPVRVYNKVWSTTPAPGDLFVVNPPRDATQTIEWEAAAEKGPDGSTVPGKHDKKLNDFYHFRVVAQAYALKPGDENVLAKPWAKPGDHVAASQALRILQIQSLQLFKYALFYGADTPVGDLDLQTGGTIWVQKGAVHSNGAIYIRGGESNGFYNKNWHWMASGDGYVDADVANQNIFLGEEDWPITICGVAGIYRMGKTANHLAAQHELYIQNGQGTPVRYDPDSPFDTPTQANRFVKDKISTGGSRLDLNGDHATSGRHKFNGVNFTRDNDSRTPQEFVKAFSGYARDGKNGGSTVRTLQNIPELGGRPFEPQAVVSTVSGVPVPLFGKADLSEVSRYARDSTGTARTPLFYDPNPTDAPGSVSRTRATFRTPVTATTTAAGRRPILAEEMRLWWDTAMKVRDVLPPDAERPLLDLIPGDWGTATVDRERPAYYKVDGTLDTPKYYDAAQTEIASPVPGTGVLSFPGVGFTLPADYNDPITGNPVRWEPKFFGSGFSPREVKGYYLEAALFGDLAVGGTRTKQQQYYANTGNTPTNIGKTGIVIREHRWQQRPMLHGLGTGSHEQVAAWNYYWPGSGLPGEPLPANTATTVAPIPRPSFSSSTPTKEEKRAYVQYLCSQYTVLFCGRNITAPFFGQILSQTNVRDFIVTEDEFIDARESGYMWGMYGAEDDAVGDRLPAHPDAFYQRQFFNSEQNSTIPGAVGNASREYRQNVLTVHMRAFQLWLRTTSMADLGYSYADHPVVAAHKARHHFTGVLYNHRTRRSDSMHALFSPELDWPGMARITHNVEVDPGNLVDQSHFRAYWLSDVVAPLNVMDTTKPMSKRYPPVNFPWNWREPSGPLESTRCATRLKGQLNDPDEVNDASYYRVFWDHKTPTSTDDALGTSAFTYITPQRFYLWGHFCYKVNAITSESAGRQEIDANIASITPCAVFADNFTMQSVRWRDEYAQDLPVRGDGYGYPDGRAESTCYFTSMVINNSPNAAWNCGSFGSAGQEGTFRMMEDWGYGATHVWWSGSQVVMNMGRYHHSGHNFIHYGRNEGRDKAPAHMGIGAFHASTNHYIFNTNLFSSAGRPPLSPSGVTATRVVNQVTDFGE